MVTVICHHHKQFDYSCKEQHGYLQWASLTVFVVLAREYLSMDTPVGSKKLLPF
jgi:hypothetical protein